MRWLPIPPNLIAAALRLYRRTEQAELGLIAAGVAFFGFLAIFPAVAAVIAIWGALSDPGVLRTEIELLRGVLPPEAFSLILEQVEALLAVSQRGIGWATALSTLFALWSARAGVAALIRGLNAIHGLPNRSGHWHQLWAFLLMLALVGLVMGAMLLSVVVPLVAQALPDIAKQYTSLSQANQALGLALVVLAVGLAYRWGPNHQRPPPLFTWGLLVAVVLWGSAARGFMIYLENFPAYNRIYGSIGAVAALLMSLYVSAFAVLLGAAVDAERGRRKPLGGPTSH
ncbi:MAG: YihY/virulence factor BrkB family protein [Paracoccaceae bacterium]